MRVSVEELVAYLEFILVERVIAGYKFTSTDRMYYVLLRFGRRVRLRDVNDVVKLPRKCKVADGDLFDQYMKIVYLGDGGDTPQPFWSNGDFCSHVPRDKVVVKK